MSSQTDPAGGPAAPPELDEDRPSMAAALSRVETLVSALEADGVRVSEVNPAIGPEHLRDGYVTVSLTVGLRVDQEPPSLASSDGVNTVDSAEGNPGTSAADTVADGGSTTEQPTPRSPSGPASPAVRPVDPAAGAQEKTWYCSVCGHGPFPRKTILNHRAQEERCSDGEPVADEPSETIPSITDEAWYCSECDYGPATRQGVKVHAGHAHDSDADAVLSSSSDHEHGQSGRKSLEDYADHLDVEAAIDGLDGVQTVHEVQRELRIQRADARKLVKRLGFYGDLKRGREPLGREEVKQAVTAEFEEVDSR